MPLFKKITFLILLLFLIPLTLPAQNNDEPMRLPESVITGEGNASKTDFSFPVEAQSVTPLSSPPKKMPAILPSLSFSDITVKAGSQETFGVSFRRQNAAWSFGAAVSRQGIEPFPETVKELSFSVSRKKMIRAAVLEFSLSGSGLWDLPASKKSGTRFVPAAIPESEETMITLGAHLAPDRPLSTRASITYHLLNKNGAEGAEAIWPRWSAEVGVTARISPKTGLTLFVDCPFDYDNSAVKTEGMCLPGAALCHQWLPNNFITVTVKNLTSRKYEVLPGFFGPGTTAVLSYSHSF